MTCVHREVHKFQASDMENDWIFNDFEGHMLTNKYNILKIIYFYKLELNIFYQPVFIRKYLDYTSILKSKIGSTH